MHGSGRPAVDVVDSTWLAAAPATVGAVLADPANWAMWWPGLDLRVQQLRGPIGVRWFVGAVADTSPALTGSAEVWLEPTCEGTVAHFFLRLDAASGATPRALARRIEKRYRLHTKRAFWALGDRLDPGRTARLTSVPHVPTA